MVISGPSGEKPRGKIPFTGYIIKVTCRTMNLAVVAMGTMGT